LYKLIKTSDEYRKKNKILKNWTSLCSERTKKYKKISNLVTTIQNFHSKVDKYSQFHSLNNIKLLSIARKNDDKMNAKAENIIKKTRKIKLFKILKLNSKKNKDFKQGIKKLEIVLQDHKNQLYAM
jgi:hypothetical protein